MEKIMYALWRPSGTESESWASALRGEVADALAAAGARGLQVNIDDGAVAPAVIRMSTFDRPIEGVVSLWLDTATGSTRERTDEILAAASDRRSCYLVTESVPLAPPDAADGSRTDGFANIAFLRRPSHLDQATWLQRWQGQHTQVALETQSTFGYIQNVVVRPLTPDAPQIDGIVEELFPIAALTDFHVFFDTGGSDDELSRRMTAMTTSVANFSGDDAALDVVPTSRYVQGTPPAR